MIKYAVINAPQDLFYDFFKFSNHSCVETFCWLKIVFNKRMNISLHLADSRIIEKRESISYFDKYNRGRLLGG